MCAARGLRDPPSLQLACGQRLCNSHSPRPPSRHGARSRCAVQESGPAGAQLREQDSEREGAKEEAGEQDNGSLGGGESEVAACGPWRRRGKEARTGLNH